MSAASSKEIDAARALDVWREYQRQHDVSDRDGETVGIDPVSGRVWFGESASDIWRQMEHEGMDIPLYYIRVGREYYLRKGSRR